MKAKIVPITKNNLNLVAAAAAKFGMPRSARWLERCMFDPTVDDLTEDKVRGHMSVADGGEVVAIQGYYYMPGYFRQKKILMNTGCIMGADAKCGEELICCLDRNKETTIKGEIGVGNCIANERSAKVQKVYNKMKEGPDAVRLRRISCIDCAEPIFSLLRRKRIAFNWLVWAIWLLTRPFNWIVNAVRLSGYKAKSFRINECSRIDQEKFGRFWNAFLVGNTGLVTSRDPARLAWLFDGSMHAGFVSILTAEKDGEIAGYILLRRYPCVKGPLSDFSICDICAVNNDVECLRELLRAAIRHAASHRGAKVTYSGGMPNQDAWLDAVKWHRCTRKAFSPFFYGTKDPEIGISLERNEGWFFGPFDGEKCLGHGRYIDV